MGDCLHPFGRTSSLVRRLHAPTGKWTDLGAGQFRLRLTHYNVMDQAVKPVPGDFLVTTQGVPIVVGAVLWTDATTLDLIFIPGPLVDPVYLTFPTSVPNYRDLGGVTMDPYGPILVPDPPLAKKKYQEWLLTHPAPLPPFTPAWFDWLKEGGKAWEA